MKALFATLLLSALLAPMLSAQEDPAPAAQKESAPVPVETPVAPAVAQPVPPISGQPSAANSTSDLTPAKEDAVIIPQGSIDLLPSADPGPTQILPEPMLIPETPEMTEKPDGSAILPPGSEEPSRTIKRSKTEIAADELALKVRFRQVKTRAMGDPAVQAEWNNAQAARTDAEKRAGLKRYYQLLYGRMAKIDKSLEKQIHEKEQISVRRLQQNRIQPSVSRNPADRGANVQIKPEDREERVQIKSEDEEDRVQIGMGSL